MMLWKLIDRAASLAAAAGIVFALMGHSSPAAASLVIHTTLSPSLQSNPAVVTTIQHLTDSYETFFSDDIEVRVQFGQNSDYTAGSDFAQGCGLGCSNTSFFPSSYVEFRDRLNSHRTTAKDNLAFASSVPNRSTSPVDGHMNMLISTANGRVLGFPTAVAYQGFDSTITLNLAELSADRTGQPNLLKYDLLDVAAHELNEVLGLGSGLNSPTPRDSMPQDLFRYSGPPSPTNPDGMRSYTMSSTEVSYLSYDQGATSEVLFNQENCLPDTDPAFRDCGDWAHSNIARQQDAVGALGKRLDWDYIALGNLDVIGWTLVPEPSTGLLLATGLLGLAIRRRTHWCRS